MSTFTDSVQTLLGKLFARKAQEVRTELVAVANTVMQKDYTGKTSHVNTKLCRELYRNINNDYALAGQLVKPIINNNVNFIGEPKIVANAKAKKVLDQIDYKYRTVNKAIEIDGNVLIRARWDISTETIVLELVPTECILDTFINPLTKQITGYRLVEHLTYATPKNNAATAIIEHVITADAHKMKVVGSELNFERNIANPFKVLPIVLFTNDKLPTELYGHSEIEVIEPQLRFYHDLTYEAGAAQKRDGHPKLKVSTGNARQWVDNNFGSGTFDLVQKGQRTLVLDDRDLFINQGEDDVQYLYLNKTSGDFKQLSELTFTNLVEGSETPEINFGANLGTSLASVKEYRPIWIKKIAGKQAERGKSWIELYKLIILIYNYVHFSTIKSDDITVLWDKPNFVSSKEQSEIINAFAKALTLLKEGNAVTDKEVYDTMKELNIMQLADTFEEHQKEIERLRGEEEKRREASEARLRPEDDEETTEDTEEEPEDNKDKSKTAE